MNRHVQHEHNFLKSYDALYIINIIGQILCVPLEHTDHQSWSILLRHSVQCSALFYVIHLVEVLLTFTFIQLRHLINCVAAAADAAAAVDVVLSTTNIIWKPPQSIMLCS